jgi:hypothetical protein
MLLYDKAIIILLLKLIKYEITVKLRTSVYEIISFIIILKGF